MAKHQSKEFWQGHIAACDKSDLTQTEYCTKHNIVSSTLGYWKRKLRKTDSNNQLFYPLTIPSGTSRCSYKKSNGIIVTLRGGRFSIEVEKGFSTTTFSQVITTLEQL